MSNVASAMAWIPGWACRWQALTFHDRGTHRLKGLPDQWTVYGVQD
jgi:hypothetical protein